MSAQNTALLTLTMSAPSAVLANRFVTPLGAQAAAGVNTIGVSCTDAADGDNYAVDVLGTTVVEAGAAFSAGDSLKSDANGEAIEWATSGAKVAIALQDASGAGALVEVLLIPNVA